GMQLAPLVLIADVLPWNNGWPEAEPNIRRLNALIAEIAHDEGIPLLAFHDTLEDPDRPGRMREEWTFEGDHPNEDGYRLLADVVLRELRTSGVCPQPSRMSHHNRGGKTAFRTAGVRPPAGVRPRPLEHVCVAVRGALDTVVERKLVRPVDDHQALGARVVERLHSL